MEGKPRLKRRILNLRNKLLIIRERAIEGFNQNKNGK